MSHRTRAVAVVLLLAAPAAWAVDAQEPTTRSAVELAADKPTAPLLTFVQISDAHMSADGMRTEKLGKGNLAAKLKQAVHEINVLKPDFVVITGDLVEVGTAAEYEMFSRIISKLTVPWHAVPGNHETLQGTWADFERYTKKRRYSAFVQNGCQFILLDGSRDEKKYYSAGRVDDRQMGWFARQLAAGRDKRYCFVLCHFPLQAKWRGNGMANPGRDRILSLLKQYKVAGFLFGHGHAHDRDYADGTTHILCAGVGWNFRAGEGYRVYRVYPDKTVSEWRPIGGRPARFTVALPNPRRGDLASEAATRVAAPTIVKDKTPGLAMYLKLDGAHGTTVPDYTGGAAGSVHPNDWAGPAWVAGKAGTALTLSGMGQYVDVPSSDAIDMKSNDFSVAFWLKRSDPRDTSMAVLHKCKSGVSKTPGYGFMLRETGGELKFTICDGQEIVQASGARLKNADWHHVVARRGGGTISLFVDGRQAAQAKETLGSLSNPEPLVIGKAGFANNVGGPPAMNDLFGAIDDVRVYSRALGDKEIADLARAE